MKFLNFFLFLFVLGVSSCGKLNQSDSTGTSGSVYAGRAVIKDSSGNTVAHLVQWIDKSLAVLYLTGADKYVYVETESGSYDISQFWTYSGQPSFAFSEENCTGSVAVDDDWWGPKNKVIVFTRNRYFSIGTAPTSFAVKSILDSSGVCLNITATYSGYYPLIETTQPYNFAAIAPLTITFE